LQLLNGSPTSAPRASSNRPRPKSRESTGSIGTSGMCLRLTRDAASLRPMR
jgi:hypothetical protein